MRVEVVEPLSDVVPMSDLGIGEYGAIMDDDSEHRGHVVVGCWASGGRICYQSLNNHNVNWVKLTDGRCSIRIKVRRILLGSKIVIHT